MLKDIEELYNFMKNEPDKYVTGQTYVDHTDHLLSIISQKDEEIAQIERMRQALVDSSYLIDRMTDDYPNELWSNDEINSWKYRGKEQVKEINIALGGESPC